MQNHKILVATRDDLSDIIAFEKQCFEHDVDRFPRRNFVHMLKSATSRILILRDEQGKIYAEIIGLARNFKIPSGRIYKIGVRADMKKRGIGSFLIQAIEKWFVESGMKKSCAEIRESNLPSRAMFAKNNYIETGIRVYYYAGGENAVKCWKDL